MEPEISKESGLTIDEERAINHLVVAWNNFVNLPGVPTEDLQEFLQSIHACERLIMIRIVRRAYPAYYKMGNNEPANGQANAN